MAAEKGFRGPGGRAQWPLWTAWGLFLILLGITLSAQISSGQILLPDEDAYQRLAVAKNLAGRLAWEILPGEFTSAFGTLLWPLLLAPVFLLFGANALWPVILNAILSLVLIALAYRFIREAIASPAAQAVLMAVLIAGLPLAPLAAAGMEHVLFLVLMLLFLEQWARRMQDSSRAGVAPMALTAFLLASTRYEGMLLIALAAFFLLLKKDYRAAALLPCAAALPLAVFGIISWKAGWLPVPSSVYLRRAEMIPADLSQWPSVVFRSLDVLGVNPDLRGVVLLLTLIPAWLGITGRLKSVREREFHAPAFAFLTILAYLTLVGNRGYRYDAWLVMLGAWAILPALGKILPVDFRDLRKDAVTLFAGGALAVLLAFPLINRGVQGAIQFNQSMDRTKGIVRLAADWAADCGSGPVATDAPGTIVFQTGNDAVVDMSGFVGLRAFRERRAGEIRAEWMRTEAERSGAVAAVIFHPALQAQAAQIWARAGGWMRTGCAVCGSAEIFFLSDDPARQACTVSFLKDLPLEVAPLNPEGGTAE
ncbi:MAG: hypothetical protein JW748_04055 [Anaerolineales bacterium]|nr:hypothetical protein [Anaerolineales bacterium]